MSQPKKRGVSPKTIKWIWCAAFAPFALVAVMLLLTALGTFGRIPSFEELENPRSNLATEVYSEDGRVIGTFFVQNRSYVQYADLFPSDSTLRIRLDGREVPPIVAALISTEDVRFRNHSGIDIPSLARVAVKTLLLQNTSQGGGSTITQQLAKNLFPRDTARNRGRIARTAKLVTSKFKEWITALKLEYNYTKEEIAAMYLNTVEYGSNAYGIKSAAHTFFNKEPDELNVQEAAVLVGVVNAPTRYSPLRNYDNAVARRNLVLSRMAKAGALTRKQCDSISALPIVLNFNPVSHNAGTATYFREMLRLVMNAERPRRNQFYTEWDYDEAVREYENNPIYGWCHKNRKADGKPYDIYRDGLKIYTTIDSRMQAYAEQAVQRQLEKVIQPGMDRQYRQTRSIFVDATREERERIMRQAVRYSDRYREMKSAGFSAKEIEASFDKPCRMKIFTYGGDRDTLMTPRDSILHHKGIMRAAMVSVDPRTGHVKAYVGGPNFRYFKYDMAKQGKRQIGSAIKPFVYTFAIDHLGLTPCTMVPNLPVTIETANGTAWSPKEAGKVVYDGVPHPLKWGLARSRNNYSAWVMKQAKQPAAVADFIHNMGIRSFIDPVPRLVGVERLRAGERLLDLRQRGRAHRPDLRDAHRGQAGQPHRQLHSPVAGRRERTHGLHDAHHAARRGQFRNGGPPEVAVRLRGHGDRRQDRYVEQEPRRVVRLRGAEARDECVGRRRGPVGASHFGRRGQRDGAADRRGVHEVGLRRRPSGHQPRGQVRTADADAALRLRRAAGRRGRARFGDGDRRRRRLLRLMRPGRFREIARPEHPFLGGRGGPDCGGEVRFRADDGYCCTM